MTINLSDNSPRVNYTVSQGVTQSAFAVPFEFFDDDDLNVYVDGTLKTLTTHYTTADDSGNSQAHTSGTTGFIHFTSGNHVTGATGGSSVVITRDIDIDRVTDFPLSGPFNVSTLNTELDRIIAIAADIDDAANRALILSDFDTTASLILPDVTTRANKQLGFDGSGNLVAEEGKVSSVSTSVSAVSAGGTPTASATFTASSGALALAFGLVTGNTGATGSTGAAGKNTGLAMTFSNSTSDADPGAGKVAFNNGTVSSVSEIYFDDVDDNSATVSSFIQSWDDVSNATARGILLIVKETDPSVYGLFKVSGVITNASGYSKVPVTHVVSNGSFSNTDGIQVSFAYSGADGSNGSAASIAVGSVTANTLSAGSSATAAVANAGSSSAGQFNCTFGIPTGATGATGPQGPQGPSGTGSGDMNDVIDDTSPQLGGDLDVVTHDIVSTSNRNIALTPNGSGVVRIDGSNGVDISEGAISIKNGGAQSYVRMYCESSNAHYVQLQAPAHANFSGNVTATLPNTTGTIATTDDVTALAIALG